LKDTITKQQQIIDRLENQLKSCAPLDVYSLPVRIEEERVTAFDRKDGFNYFFVIVDWKKNDRGMARQHLHLAFKQSNSSIYIYDHGPLSGRYFTVGDRIIDIDGDYFTSIIERPATEQTVHTVSTLLQPSLSSFSVVLSA
uniref:Helitron_like_N domain-containing protein n=1 Tax=Brugia timori TaxID=42155 RepID=A0A0R3QPK8_9BILA